MELFKSIAHPTELWALLKFKYGGGKEMVMPQSGIRECTATNTVCDILSVVR